MTQSSAERLHAIIESDTVQSAATRIAGHSASLKRSLEERAHEALQVAMELAENAGRDLADEDLTALAVSAIKTLDHDADPLAVHHLMISCLGGPANVPGNLRFSWEPGPKLKKAAPTPRDFDPDTCGLIGDPTALRKHMVGTTAPIPDITPEREAELMVMQNQGALATQAVLDAEDIHKAIGQLEALDFLRHVADIATAQIFERIKHGKKYKGLPYRDAEGNLRHVATLEEFCEAKLGRSYRRVKELAANLHTLGPALYESAEAIGFKARDYAALKALPESEQEIVKTALAAESKDQVLDILQDLAARHQSERAAAQKQAEDLKADLEARDKLLADKGERLDKVSLDLAKLKALPPNEQEVLRLEREEEATKALTLAVVEAQAAVNAFLGRLAAIKAAEVSSYTKDHADFTASWFCQQIQLALQENGIEADMEEIILPTWMRETAKQSPVDQEDM